MSELPPSLTRKCARCGETLPADALSCDRCHALVHGPLLEQLAVTARQQEERREYSAARNTWSSALAHLPEQSTQAQWVRDNIRRLGALVPASPAASGPGWAKRFGPLAPLLLVLLKGKWLLALLNLKFLLSLGAFVGFYWALYGLWFGIGFAALVLVHELGHFIEIRRRGLPADMPVFMPGLGAYVRWTALGVTVQIRSLISLAGPMAGFAGAAVCAIAWRYTGAPLWIGLATLSAMLNVLNLIPVWVLDGGQAIAALDWNERLMLAVCAVIIAAYFGQPVVLLVGAGAIYRLFTKDRPSRSAHGILIYYVLILAGLAYVMALAPPVPR